MRTRILLILALSSCALPEKLWKPKHPNQGQHIAKQVGTVQETKFNDEETPPPRSTIYDLSAVEIEWIVPQTRVTKYILRYGLSPDDLNEKVEISRSSLTKVISNNHGNVYRYLLSGIPTKSTVYYTLQAGNELGYSESTTINTVKSY